MPKSVRAPSGSLLDRVSPHEIQPAVARATDRVLEPAGQADLDRASLVFLTRNERIVAGSDESGTFSGMNGENASSETSTGKASSW